MAEQAPEISFIAVGRVGVQPQSGEALASYCHDPEENKGPQYEEIFNKILSAAGQKMGRGARQRLAWGDASICCLVDQQGELLYCVYTSSLAYPETMAYHLLNEVMNTVMSSGGNVEADSMRKKMRELVIKYEDPQNPPAQFDESQGQRRSKGGSFGGGADMVSSGGTDWADQRKRKFHMGLGLFAVLVIVVIAFLMLRPGTEAEAEATTTSAPKEATLLLQRLAQQFAAIRPQQHHLPPALRGNDVPVAPPVNPLLLA